jgi:hypothetical protein
MAVPYMLDNTPAERARLSRNAEGLRPMTERLFRAAGIGPGLSVLDVGCGNGDVSFLAADLVSSNGRRVRPGGVVAFVEMSARPDGSHLNYWPQTPLRAQARSWVTLGWGSTRTYFAGLQLPSVFR